MLVVSLVSAALAEKLGRPVNSSVVYGLLARHGWRNVAPDTVQSKSDPAAQTEWKKLPEALEALLTPEAVCRRKVRLIVQDEASFGRMMCIRGCWAPSPFRSIVNNGYDREFVYGAVSPTEGELDWMTCPKMNKDKKGEFLAQIHAAHSYEFIVMVVDGTDRTSQRTSA